MDRLGIGYDEISKLNKGIVYCSLTGYGQTGPYRNLPGHDVNYIGYSGILGLLVKGWKTSCTRCANSRY